MSCLIGAIDQGTSSSRFILFDENHQLKLKHGKEIKHILPDEGWMEQNPMELIDSVKECMKVVATTVAKEHDIVIENIKGIGITNQRETTILWDKTTGKCFYNAIVWCDNRTEALAKELIDRTPNKDKDYLRRKCGLPIHTYFSALKIKWLIENVPQVKVAIENGNCLFGTVDTWLIWNLTGGVSGGCHVTDVTNASRTMLMDIHTCQWDNELCQFFDIPMSILPKICSSSEVYGYIVDGPLAGIPISGCLGDQQAALVGQRCFSQGDAKNTYGTGCFLLYNTGLLPVRSNSGMLTTVAYKLGPNEPVHYALEGSVAIAGQCVRWLRDNFQLFTNANEIEGLANEVYDTAGVYFVPAFSGLFAPYWQHDARGLIIGLTNYTNKSHICRATLEAVCFQSREILEAMNHDAEVPLTSLRVDGGMTVNKLLLQLQSDILGIPVVRPEMTETTVLGAAIAAGIGVGVWSTAICHDSETSGVQVHIFKPSIDHDERDIRYSQWKEAVKRCMNWQGGDKNVMEQQSWTNTSSGWIFGMGVATGALLAAVSLIVSWRRH